MLDSVIEEEGGFAFTMQGLFHSGQSFVRQSQPVSVKMYKFLSVAITHDKRSHDKKNHD
jgi:hypothetical protein